MESDDTSITTHIQTLKSTTKLDGYYVQETTRTKASTTNRIR